MIEEIIVRTIDERIAKNRVNHQILRLIQEKTVPLNRARYEHLQKISKALNKPVPLAYTSALQLSLCPQASLEIQKLPSLPKSKSSRVNALAAADLLINRLKNLQDLKSSNQLLLKDEHTIQCWDNLRSNIVASQKVSKSISKISSHKTLKMSQHGKRKRQNLIQLAERAQRYLRQKKHDLKERYCRQEEYNNGRQRQMKPTQIQMILTTLKAKMHKNVTDEQIQRQLLKDIRENMLQGKLARLKKDINHKKIVQMR